MHYSLRKAVYDSYCANGHTQCLQTLVHQSVCAFIIGKAHKQQYFTFSHLMLLLLLLRHHICMSSLCVCVCTKLNASKDAVGADCEQNNCTNSKGHSSSNRNGQGLR